MKTYDFNSDDFNNTFLSKYGLLPDQAMEALDKAEFENKILREHIQELNEFISKHIKRLAH